MLLTIGILIAFIVGHCNGWIVAHATIAKECERLGGFYVGKKTYKCVEVEEEDNETSNKARM